MNSLSRFATLGVLALLVVYGVFKGLPLLSGPEVSLESPANGQSFGDGFAVVKGVARHANALTLDGAPLLIDEEGRFEASLVLPEGGAILSLTASDRFGREKRLERSVFIP
jgi:hypothetical protein